jgi:hypothetical protein
MVGVFVRFSCAFKLDIGGTPINATSVVNSSKSIGLCLELFLTIKVKVH